MTSSSTAFCACFLALIAFATTVQGFIGAPSSGSADVSCSSAFGDDSSCLSLGRSEAAPGEASSSVLALGGEDDEVNAFTGSSAEASGPFARTISNGGVRTTPYVSYAYGSNVASAVGRKLRSGSKLVSFRRK